MVLGISGLTDVGSGIFFCILIYIIILNIYNINLTLT